MSAGVGLCIEQMCVDRYKMIPSTLQSIFESGAGDMCTVQGFRRGNEAKVRTHRGLHVCVILTSRPLECTPAHLCRSAKNIHYYANAQGPFSEKALSST